MRCATAICYIRKWNVACDLVILFTWCDSFCLQLCFFIISELGMCLESQTESHIAVAQNGCETHLDVLSHTKLYHMQRGLHCVNNITNIHTNHFLSLNRNAVANKKSHRLNEPLVKVKTSRST